MTAIFGITGQVTSWTNNANLVGSGSAPSEFELTVNGNDQDTTAFGALRATESIQGLKSWEGRITSRIDEAQIGSAGLVAFSGISYYAVNIRQWRLELQREFEDTTAFSSLSDPEWISRTPGLFDWFGEYQGFLDSSDAVVLPAAPGDSPSLASLTLTMESGKTFAGAAGIRSLTPRASPRIANTVLHRFFGSGDLTVAGATFFPTGTLAPALDPSSDTLTLQASNGRTYSGAAFWSRVVIQCAVDEVITCEVDFQGTGSLGVA